MASDALRSGLVGDSASVGAAQFYQTVARRAPPKCQKPSRAGKGSDWHPRVQLGRVRSAGANNLRIAAALAKRSTLFGGCHNLRSP